MAKPKRRAGKPKGPEKAEACEDEQSEEEGREQPEEEEPASSKSGGFFETLGAGIKAAGEAAERLARMGMGTAELEKLRLDLKWAQSRLGEAVLKCWDDAPRVGVMPGDPAVKAPLREVKELRRKIREVEQKMAELKQAGKEP
ncbi:MAG: hypothetical protein ABSE73_25210 [Planctomycetota bacterium]